MTDAASLYETETTLGYSGCQENFTGFGPRTKFNGEKKKREGLGWAQDKDELT